MRRCIYPIVHPYWGTSAHKGNDKETKGIRNVRMICEQIRIRVGDGTKGMTKSMRHPKINQILNKIRPEVDYHQVEMGADR